MTAQVEKLMKNLGITEAEALQVIEDDKAIDKGKDLFPLTKEQAKVVKACTRADRKPTEKKVARERKADTTKADLLALLVAGLDGVAENVEVTNTEREFLFNFLDAPPPVAPGRISIIPYPPNFVKRKFAQIFIRKFSRFCAFCQLCFEKIYGILLL